MCENSLDDAGAAYSAFSAVGVGVGVKEGVDMFFFFAVRASSLSVFWIVYNKEGG